MKKYYIYLKFKNSIDGFDAQIEADSKEEALKQFLLLLDKPKEYETI